MSFTMAVWVGSKPASDAEAEREFSRLHAQYFTTKCEPAPEILAFIAAATARFPDLIALSDDDVDDSVWSDGPLINNASGPIFYFGLCRHGVDTALPFLVELARTQGLAGFDPQSGRAI